MPDAEIELFQGNSRWEDVLDNRDAAPSSPAVYAIVSNRQFGRLNLESRVLYVGKALRLGGLGDRTRLYGYRYKPDSSRDGRVRLLARQAMDLGHELTLRWSVMASEEDAAAKEANLLLSYIEVHLEVPPLNSVSR